MSTPGPQPPAMPTERDERQLVDAGIEQAAARLRERVDADHPAPWMQEEEREISGVFLRLEKGRTRFGPAWIVVIRETLTGVERAVWLLHTVLRNEFTKARPVEGEVILVRYDGMVTPEGGGAPYGSYKVLVDRPTTNGSWDEIAPPEGDFPTQPVPTPQSIDANRDQAAAAAVAQPAVCTDCGGTDGRHYSGCSEDIPF